MDGMMNLSPVQAFMILLLGGREYEPIKGKTGLQQEMFLLTKNTRLTEENYLEPHF